MCLQWVCIAWEALVRPCLSLAFDLWHNDPFIHVNICIVSVCLISMSIVSLLWTSIDANILFILMSLCVPFTADAGLQCTWRCDQNSPKKLSRCSCNWMQNFEGELTFCRLDNFSFLIWMYNSFCRKVEQRSLCHW